MTLKFVFSMFFLLSALNPNLALASMSCSILCDTKDLNSIHEWQFEKAALKEAPPKSAKLVNCFQPLIACRDSSCGSGGEVSVRLKRRREKLDEVLNSNCHKSEKHGELLTAAFPDIGPLIGDGQITIKIKKMKATLFYKALAGE